MSPAGNDELPTPEELDGSAIPAYLRRAPRFGRIVLTGALFGFALGAGVALGLPGKGAAYVSTVVLFVGLGFALIGGLVAGAIATRIDGPDPQRAAKPKHRKRGE